MSGIAGKDDPITAIVLDRLAELGMPRDLIMGSGGAMCVVIEPAGRIRVEMTVWLNAPKTPTG